MDYPDEEERRRKRYGPDPEKPESPGDAVAELLQIFDWLYQTGDDAYRAEVDEWEAKGLTRLEMARRMYQKYNEE